jgi:hypothetical protein
MRLLKRFAFKSNDFSQSERLLWKRIELIGLDDLVSNWCPLQLTLIIIRMSLEERQNHYQEANSYNLIFYKFPFMDRSGVMRVEIRAWLLAIFSTMYSYILLRHGLTIRDLLLLPGIPECLVVNEVTFYEPLWLKGNVIMPSIEGLSLWPFARRSKPVIYLN